MRYYTKLVKLVDSTIRLCDLESHSPHGEQSKEHVENIRQISGVYALWLSIFLNLGLDLGWDNTACEQKCSQFVEVVNSMTYSDLAEHFSNLYDYIRRPDVPYSAFKRQMTPETRRLLSPWAKYWCETHDPKGLQNLLTLLRFPFRSRIRDSRLEVKAEEDFISIEGELTPYNLNLDQVSGLIKSLNEILKAWLSDFQINLDTFCPRHGTGAVAERRVKSKYDKYMVLRHHALVDYLLRKAGSSETEFLPIIGVNSEHFDEGFDHVSVVQFVPKNATKLRTVCKEAATQMYYQKGVQLELYRYISHHKYLKWHIPLQEQDMSRQACIAASRTGLLCTIDQSAASDRISWDLVKRLFSGTRLLPWLLATRSREFLLPSGKRVTAAKFAPMGSALCFPVMCLTFAAIVEYAKRRAESSAWCRFRIPRSEGGRTWLVYGDDIICPTTWAKSVMLIINRLGMKVNVSKSFVDETNPYRESCGVEAWDGHDVTPFLFPRLGDLSKDPSAKEFATLKDIANRAALQFHLPFTRYVALQRLRRDFGDALIYTPSETVKVIGPVTGTVYERVVCEGIWSPNPTNYHLRKRTLPPKDIRKPYYCYTRVRGRKIQLKRTRFSAVIADDELRYFEWLRDSRRPSGEAEESDPYAFQRLTEPCLKMAWHWERLPS